MKHRIIYSEQIIRDGERMIISLLQRFFEAPCVPDYVARIEWSNRHQSSEWECHHATKKEALDILQRACNRNVHYQQLTRPLHARQCQLPIVA